MARIFLTGATGYVGGQVLHSISSALPDLSVTALVRNSSKAQIVKAAFPKVETVEGSLDDAGVIAREAGDADIILNLADSTHLKSVEAIHAAVKQRATDRKPAHWIQLIGAKVLAAAETVDPSRIPGSSSDVTFDDLDDVAGIHKIIKEHPFRAVDNYMLQVAADTPQVNTALVVGPLIYGQGCGPDNKRSIQIPGLARATLKRRRGLQVGKGQSRWGNVHVADLADLIVHLVRAAEEGKPNGKKIWGMKGIYIASVGERSFEDLSQRVATVAAQKGLIPNNEVDEVLGEEAGEILPAGPVLFGTNARGVGRRGQEVLGWKPKYPDKSIEDEISRSVEQEAANMGQS